jgi:hypothetical protein
LSVKSLNHRVYGGFIANTKQMTTLVQVFGLGPLSFSPKNWIYSDELI